MGDEEARLIEVVLKAEMRAAKSVAILKGRSVVGVFRSNSRKVKPCACFAMGKEGWFAVEPSSLQWKEFVADANIC